MNIFHYRLLMTSVLAASVFAAPLAANAQLAAPVQLAQATAPADSNIKAAAGDITRHEKAASKLRPKSPRAKQILKLLKISEGRLKGSKNKDHPSWIETNQRLQALKQHLNGLIAGKSPSAPAVAKPSPSTPAPSQPAAAQTAASKQAAPKSKVQPASSGPGPADPNVERAGREIDMIARQTRNLRPNDRRGGMRFHKDLGRIAKVLNGAPDKKHPVWRSTVDNYRKVKNHIVTTLMKGYNANMKKILINIDKMTEMDFLRKDTSDAVKKDIETNWQGAKALGAPKHPSVKLFIKNTKAADAKLAAGINAAIKEHNKLGDVKALVAAIEERMQQLKVPQPLREPFTADQITAYVKQIQNVRNVSAKDYAYLQKIKGKTPLIASQRLSRLLHWVGGKPGESEKSGAQTVQAVDAWAKATERHADFLLTTNIANEGHVANRLLGAGDKEENLNRLKDALHRIETASALDTAMGRTDGPDRADSKAKVEKAMAAYTDMHAKALAASRMPEAAQDDSKFIKIAEETLAKKKYKTVNPHKRLVINSKVRRKEKKEGVLYQNTITVYHFVWDQYQVATAEKVGDDYYIWYTTLKYFHKGGPTTPTETWIISGRHKSNQILEENISK